MAQAAQYAEWLQNNQDKKDSDLYARALDAYKTARTGELKAVQVKPVEAKPTPSFTDRIASIPGDISAVTSERIVQPVMRSMGMDVKENTQEVKDKAYGSYPGSVFNFGEKLASGAAQGVSYLSGKEIEDDLFGWTGINKPAGRLGPQERGYLAQAIRERTKTLDSQSQKAREDTGRGSFDLLELAANFAVPTIGAAAAGKGVLSTMNAMGKTGLVNAMLMPTANENIFAGKAEQAATGYAAGAGFGALGRGVEKLGKLADDVTRPLWFRNKKGSSDSLEDMFGAGITKDVREILSDMTKDDKTYFLDADNY